MTRFRVASWAAAFALAATTFSMSTISAQTTSWKIDVDHSEADFAVKHMSISTVHGSFRGLSGVVRLDPADIARSSVEATIDVNSIDTGVGARDADLKSPKFFDTARFPSMTFKSTSVSEAGDHFDVTGDLTLHGVTKQVVLHLEQPGKAETGMDGKSLHRGFAATTTIDRKDFGIAWSGTLKSGDAALGDDVKIELNIEAVQE